MVTLGGWDKQNRGGALVCLNAHVYVNDCFVPITMRWHTPVHVWWCLFAQSTCRVTHATVTWDEFMTCANRLDLPTSEQLPPPLLDTPTATHLRSAFYPPLSRLCSSLQTLLRAVWLAFTDGWTVRTKRNDGDQYWGLSRVVIDEDLGLWTQMEMYNT